MSFKPDIDDVRESPALIIMEKLINHGYEIFPCDPNIIEYKNLKIYNINEIINNVDIILLLVKHSKFKNIDFKDKLLIDFCGLL